MITYILIIKELHIKIKTIKILLDVLELQLFSLLLTTGNLKSEVIII